MKQRLCILATALLTVPQTAHAHGDHEGVHGFVHLLTSAGHYGLALFMAVGAAMLGRKLVVLFRNARAGKE